MGDGYHNEQKLSLTLELHVQDIDILEKFRNSINTNKPFFYRDIITKNKTISKHVIFTLTSRILSESLIKLQCRQNKSFTMDIPLQSIPRDLIRHFVRGLYDADGSISFTKNIKKNSIIAQSCLCVSNICCQTLGKIIEDELNLYYYICKPNKNHNTEIRNFNIWGKYRIKELINWLYQDANIYLDRKYQKYMSILNQINEL